MQAVRVVMAQLERQATTLIWKANPRDRSDVTDCVMRAAKAFSEALAQCKEAPKPAQPPRPEGGEGPDCGPGFHLEYDVCVPDV
jgi:hypothetical protein